MDKIKDTLKELKQLHMKHSKFYITARFLKLSENETIRHKLEDLVNANDETAGGFKAF